MTLQELLNLNLIWENVVVVDLDNRNQYNLPAKTTALKVFNRSVTVNDFRADKQNGCSIQDCLNKNVRAIFGSKDKYKTVIEVTTKS